jgi:methyltransferase (TIGR00027 family)
MVAAARAIETHHEHSLVQDEFAERFVRAARTSVPLPTRIEDVELGDDDPVWGRGGRYFALRTRVFDDFLCEAVRSAPQVVLLGAGLDSRAFRLHLPSHVRFFELDREDVIAFKLKVLRSIGETASVAHELVVTDLTGTWDRALLHAGFDIGMPTTWIAEGLFPYLPAVVEDQLIRTLETLSAPGSHVGFEILTGQETPQVREHELYETTEAKIGSNLAGLFGNEPRPDSAGVLRAAGWTLTSSPVAEFTASYGRGPEPGADDPIERARWVFGRKA